MTQKLHHFEIWSYFTLKKLSHLFYNYNFINIGFSINT